MGLWAVNNLFMRFFAQNHSDTKRSGQLSSCHFQNEPLLLATPTHPTFSLWVYDTWKWLKTEALLLHVVSVAAASCVWWLHTRGDPCVSKDDIISDWLYCMSVKCHSGGWMIGSQLFKVMWSKHTAYGIDGILTTTDNRSKIFQSRFILLTCT